MDKALSEMSKDEQDFLIRLMDVLKLFYRQRAALFAILGENIKNWEPVYRIMQDDPEIAKEADERFAFFYESLRQGERVSDMTPLLKDKLGNKPN